MSKRASRMNRRESAVASQGAIVAANDNRSQAVEAFTFGDPEPVLSRATMLECIWLTRDSLRFSVAPISFMVISS